MSRSFSRFLPIVVAAVLAASSHNVKELTNKVILLADRKNGAALEATEGPYRVIVPDEARPARWAKQVVRVRLVAVK